MLSTRFKAQLGLVAASLTLVTSMTVLVAGSGDPSKSTGVSPVVSSVSIAPLASGQLPGVSIAPAQPIIVANR